jgi:hypothetical protein
MIFTPNSMRIHIFVQKLSGVGGRQMDRQMYGNGAISLIK